MFSAQPASVIHMTLLVNHINQFSSFTKNYKSTLLKLISQCPNANKYKWIPIKQCTCNCKLFTELKQSWLSTVSAPTFHESWWQGTSKRRPVTGCLIEERLNFQMFQKLQWQLGWQVCSGGWESSSDQEISEIKIYKIIRYTSAHFYFGLTG